MQVDHPVCCGIDVHKDTRCACLRCVEAHGQVRQEGRALAPTSPSLLACAAWLVEQPCPMGARESTGGYGKPVSHGFCRDFGYPHKAGQLGVGHVR